MNSANSNLPPIDECLFGPTRICPKTLTKEEEQEEKKCNTSSNGGGNFRAAGMSAVSNYDSLYQGHWGDAAQEKHSVDIAKLRRICSQGIADEGSYRGIAWRVLIGYLPREQINETWAKTIQPQRELYQSLMEQYLANPTDPGRELRGMLGKRLQQNNHLRQNFNELRRLDEEQEEEQEDEDDTNSEAGQGNSNDGGSDDEKDSQPSPEKPPQSSELEYKPIVDQLPAEYREEWKKAGIRLDKQTQSSMQTAAALGINHLMVPKTFATKDEFDVFLQDAQLLEEIRKDVVRTHPDLYFFLEPQANLGLRRYAALERILFLWSKLNRGVRYVQGMNEIVGTIYYVLANDHNSDWAIHAEADTYFLFHTLMIEMRDVFVPDLDTSSTGIQGRIDNMQRLLQTHDPEVHEHLQECGIDASFFAIRWLTTLLSREFLLPDTIRLWDSMFASTHKENFLRYVCGTMVMNVRENLLKGDFSTCLRLLQSYPPANVDDILESSRALWIYESQINIACHKGGISLHQALQTVSPPPAIIMAFGLKSGIAPRIKDQVRDAVLGAPEGQGVGLLGRAKRFWNGWGGAETAATDTANNNTAAHVNGGGGSPTKSAGEEPTTTKSQTSPTSNGSSTSPTQSAPPPRPRFWNRGRSNETTTSDNTTNLAALSGDEESEKVVVPEQSTTLAAPPPRRRIWNRGGSAGSNGTAVSTTPTKTEETPAPARAPAPPLRSRLWNRGSGRATTTTTTTEVS